MATKIKSGFGWVRDDLDQRDLQYAMPEQLALPSSVDLRSAMPEIYDQGNCNSCVGNALAASLQYERMQHNKTPNYRPSRLFLYYNARLLDGDQNYDGGCQIRLALKGINKYGYCAGELWRYLISKVKVRPSTAAYRDGETHKVYKYESVRQDKYYLQQLLASGQPIIFGFGVYQSYQSRTVSKTGIVPLPERSERRLGGHAVLLVGYDNNRQLYKFRNSYGTGWGDAGNGYLPYAYVENPQLAGDFWIVREV
jgi:C1A family cysteine protease